MSRICNNSKRNQKIYSLFRPPPPLNQSPQFIELLKDSVLEEGQKCVLRARVTGLPVPNITWFKDGISVGAQFTAYGGSDTDYKTSFDENDGLCQLLIEETFVADSANWSVRASNIGGYAESHAKLTVKETKPPEPEGEPPRLIVPLSQVNVDEGDTAFFSCQVEGLPVPKFSWYKNGTLIDPIRSNHHFSIKDFKGESALKIDNVGVQDKVSKSNIFFFV